MPSAEKSDILMQFVQGGTPLQGETFAQKEDDDKLMKDFHPAPTADDYCDFFAVQKFDFGVEMKDSDSKSKKEEKPGSTHKVGTKGTEKSKGNISFMEWRVAKTEDLNDEQLKKDKKYKLNFEEFNFTRTVDSCSPKFFEACCKNVTFDSAVLVKRVSINQYKLPMAFLRIDFEKVLLTGVTWDDGDILSETCKFICQKVKITYMQQNDDGDLSLTGTAEWDYDKDSKRDEEE